MLMRIAFLLLGFCGITFAANDTNVPPEANDTKVLPQAHVRAVVHTGYKGYSGGVVNTTNAHYARLGDTITLEVSNLFVLQTNASAQRRPIALFLGGMEMTNIFPQPVSTSMGASTNALTFQLQRSDQNSSVWRALLRRPFHNGFASKIDDYRVSVGMQKGEPVSSDATLGLVAYEPRPRVIGWAIAIVIVLVGFILLAGFSDLLRDKGPEPAGGRRPYSLARVQMACWFVIVAVAYIVIWMITGELDTLNVQVLTLMGISSATYLSAVAMDQGVANRPAAKHEFWVLDILSDNDGISFHRFQIVVWTMILGAMFVNAVFNELRMPEFSATMLGLMGLSAGTYLGFKFPGVRSENEVIDKPKNLKAEKFEEAGVSKVRFKVDAAERASKHELWTKKEGDADYALAGTSSAAQPEVVTASFPTGKKVNYKWRGATEKTVGPFSDEQSYMP